MPLAITAQSRDNNFNLLRFAAALVVLASHSYPLVYGHNGHEPLFRQLGTTMGLVAVDAFFFISGYLNTHSLLRGASAKSFIISRALRIFPALWVMILVTVLGLGLAFSTLPLRQFLAHAETGAYIGYNTTLFFGARYSLPSTFAQLPYPNAVNGSLWSLPIEVRLYAGLLVLWLGLGLFKPWPRKLARSALPIIALGAGLYFIWAQRHPTQPMPLVVEARLLFFFAQGAAFALWQEKIRVRTLTCVLVVMAIVASALWPAWFYPVYFVGFPLLLLYLAHVPGGAIRTFNKLGDPSYGIYIYAFPVQQSVMALLEPRAPWLLTALATPVVIGLALGSWHLIEKPCLGLKTKLSARLSS